MEFNPIKSVDGKTCRCPSSYQWKLADVSASDAGRTEDTVMHKNRIGQTVGIELSWNNISTQGLWIKKSTSLLPIPLPSFLI